MVVINSKSIVYIASICVLGLVLTACRGGEEGASSNQVFSKNGSKPISQAMYNNVNAHKTGVFVSGMPPVLKPNNNDMIWSCKTELSLDNIVHNVSGSLQFERPTLNKGKLDFNNTIIKPARGIVLEALEYNNGSCTGSVAQTTIVDGKGEFAFNLDNSKQYCLRARSQLYREGPISWDYSVTDNTNDFVGYYLLDSTPFTPGDVNTPFVINLLAKTGWDISVGDYQGPRSAAPFAILDVACELMDDFIVHGGLAELKPLAFRWSDKNNTSSGLLTNGDVGGAFYSISRYKKDGNYSSVNEIYLLGDQYSDSDEFDYHVIAHEMIHYLTLNYSRSDSLGGSHRLNDYLDMTVAFDEGFASGMATVILSGMSEQEIGNHKLYTDTLNIVTANDNLSFIIDEHQPHETAKGWYSETSVTKTVYDLFEDASIQVTKKQLYETLFKQRETKALVSMFSFIAQLKKLRPDVANNIDQLAQVEGFDYIEDDYGSNETLAGNDEKIINYANTILPIYKNLPLGSVPVSMCSIDDFKVGNGLGVYQRFKLSLSNDQVVNLRAVLTSGNAESALPTIMIEDNCDYYNVEMKRDVIGASYSGSVNLKAGEYIVSIATKSNTFSNTNIGKYCYNVSAE